jgi:rubrerythrin
MIEQECIRVLNSLTQLDLDAASAYDRAIDRCEASPACGLFKQFRDEHLAHAQELVQMIRTLGGIPIEPRRDSKTFFIEKFAAARSRTGSLGAFEAMRLNEELCVRIYEEALAGEALTDEAQTLLTRFYDEEVYHLAYFEGIIDEEDWLTRGPNYAAS